MKLIGLTGGMGSGKTTVAKVFRALGVPVFFADEAGRFALAEDPDVIAAVKRHFGDDIYKQGKPDRSALAQAVFNHPERLKQLNAIVHPAVARLTKRWQDSLPASTSYCIREAAILFESGAAATCDAVMCVSADEDLRIERVLKRDPAATKVDTVARMQQQWPQQKKEALSKWVIDNNGAKSVLQQVLAIDAELRAQG